jgi:hypothetical protein
MEIRTEISIAGQKGASIFATFLVVVLIGLFAMSGLKVVPAYLDNNVIVGAIEAMDDNTGLTEMNIREIRDGLSRSLITNGIRDFDFENVQLVEDGRNEYLDINYEARAPLFYNIEAVVVFTNRFEL